MASTKLITNQFVRDYVNDPEYLQRYKGGLDMAMDGIDYAIQAMNIGKNIQLQRELLHIKWCIAQYKEDNLPIE